MSTKPWTRKDVRILCNQLNTFWLERRPLTENYVGDHEPVIANVRLILSDPRARKEIVLAYLRSWREHYDKNYSTQCECIGNALVRGCWGDSTKEMIERHTKQAQEADASARRTERLVHRVYHEGLPEVVLRYDPIERRVLSEDEIRSFEEVHASEPATRAG